MRISPPLPLRHFILSTIHHTSHIHTHCIFKHKSKRAKSRHHVYQPALPGQLLRRPPRPVDHSQTNILLQTVDNQLIRTDTERAGNRNETRQSKHTYRPTVHHNNNNTPSSHSPSLPLPTLTSSLLIINASAHTRADTITTTRDRRRRRNRRGLPLSLSYPSAGNILHTNPHHKRLAQPPRQRLVLRLRRLPRCPRP